MKITKRQLRRIIKEAITGNVHSDPNKESFLDIAMNAISQADYKRAAGAIMDSYMIDDVWDEEEQALIDMLASSRLRATSAASPMEIEAIANSWIDGKRTGKWAPNDTRDY